MHRVTREIEFKLEVDPAHAGLVHAHPLLEEAVPSSRSQLTVYYDTPAMAFRRRGYSLRVREIDGRFTQTLKPAAESIGLVAREEFEAVVDSLQPDLQRLARTPLEPLMRADELGDLIAIIRSEVRRTSWRLDRGAKCFQVDFDEGEIVAGNRSQRLSELEFELIRGHPALLIGAVKELAEQVPVRVGVLTKPERGYLLAEGAFEKATKAAPVHIYPGLSVAEAFELTVHACLKQYRLNEPLVIERYDAPALHQARVAMRRLRAAFSLFRPAVADVEFTALREGLRWFTAQLGDARNLDVYLERELIDAERRLISARRDQAYDHVVAAMNSRRLLRLMVELVAWIAIGPWRLSKHTTKPIEHFAGKRLDKLWETIEPVGRDLAHVDEVTRHELRIQVKKLRYAIEFLRGLYADHGKIEKKFAAAVEELQESLGKLNDLTIARSFVTEPADDWLIGEPEEQMHMRDAEHAFRELTNVGPFWRSPQRG